ncbi:hypothetical protein [Novosphingobium sp. BL-52-GroH]|uniref:hypothetical protein n=1 Tax=Novosphingobium sp. BL-52-GroH TaxID=3349877 RepID=UPI00384DB6ED
MTPTPRAIADHLVSALRAGGPVYADALTEYWGDGAVDLVHEPALPMDAPMTVATMRQERATIDRAFYLLMPDFHYEAIEAKVIGAVVFLFCDQCGTLANGTTIRSPLCTRLTIEQGRIVKVVLGIDLDANAPLTAAFEAMAKSA